MNRGRARTLLLALVALVLSLALASAPATAAVKHEFLRSFNGQEAPAGPFATVMSVAADSSGGASNGDVYVASDNLFESSSLVDKLHADGSYAAIQITGAETPQGSFSFLSFSSFLASGIAVDNSTSVNRGEIYVGDIEHNVVDRFSESGHYLCQITGAATPSISECNGAKGSETPSGSFAPTGLAVDAAGDLYVADGEHDVIDEFASSGEYVRTLADPHITAPASIAVDSNGNLYVTNASIAGSASSFNVVKLDASGSFVSVLDGTSPTSVAIDPTTGHVDVYEDPEGGSPRQIAEYNPAGNLLDRFGAGRFEQMVLALTVGPTGDVYAGQFTFGEGVVDQFGPDLVVPDVTIGPVTNVEQTTATLSGHVDPDASQGGGNIVSCQFEYGTSTSYGQVAPCSPSAPYSAGTDVSAALAGLTPSTRYHFHLAAANASGSNQTEDQTFTTRGPPDIHGEVALNAITTTATLNANVNPFGYDTTCRVQYVDEAEFQSTGYATATTSPCSPMDLGSGFGEQRASAALSGLLIGTTYHFRFIATNSAGTTDGVDQTFATFGVKSFSFGVSDREGQSYTLAGGHPYELVDTFVLATTNNEFGNPNAADTNLKDVRTELPPGLIGNPHATAKCRPAFVAREECAGATQVGLIKVRTANPHGGSAEHEAPLYNIVPPKGLAAQFGAAFAGLASVHIDAKVRSGGDYGITADSFNISSAEAIDEVSVALWGVPAEASHDSERYCSFGPGIGLVRGCPSGGPLVPFLRDPTSCPGTLTTTMRVDSWQAPGTFIQANSSMVGMTGCDTLDFEPAVAIQPESTSADSPTGLHVDLRLPQNENPVGLAEADLRDAVVTLPRGVTVNPSSANGLQACSLAQIELHGPEPARCPDASKIGTVQIVTPLLDHPLVGGVYLAQQGNHGPGQGENPFGSLLALYVAVDDPETGVVVKLAGEVTADPITGQLTTSFLNSPQLPFAELKLDIIGGPRAPLATPPACGGYTTTISLTPWSAPESGPPATPSSSFYVSSGPGDSPCPDTQPFSPSLGAGSTNLQAGAFTPLMTTFSREDGNQNLSAVQLHLPEGLLGKLASVTPCPEPEAAEGTCGAQSEIGHTVASVGLGPDPYTITGGQVFITGPYKGAPYGLSIAQPAKAGPFDLGSGPCDCVVVRAKIDIDPHTSALTVTSDPLPTILQGVPVQLKRVNVTVDRPGFTFNPTNCSQLAITAVLTSEQGATAPISVPFEVANCATLPFKPTFTVLTQAKTSKANGASLHVKVTSGPGQANIGKVKVDLPKQLPSRLTTLQKACRDATFNANPASCPAGSVVGTATAVTPVLKSPLTGPAYLVSHAAAAFPDLVVILQGEGITLDLVGNTDIKKGITISTFNSVPDAPISTFDLVLPEGPHSVLTANGSLCNATKTVSLRRRVARRVHGRTVHVLRTVKRVISEPLSMPTTITGQNGAVIKQTTKIAVSGCPKHKKAKPRKKSKGKKR